MFGKIEEAMFIAGKYKMVSPVLTLKKFLEKQ